jgi:hypothetical protein
MLSYSAIWTQQSDGWNVSFLLGLKGKVREREDVDVWRIGTLS